MRLNILFLILISIFSFAKAENFETVVEFNHRPGNLAVSSKGEIFATMHPIDGQPIKIMKFSPKGKNIPITHPMLKQVTSDAINTGIADAIGIFITKNDVLWILDMGGKVKNKNVSPKFIVWDLKKERLIQIITISQEVLVSNSFLQDFAVDEKNNFAFIADMTIGGTPNPAIIAVNTKTGEMKRLLNGNTFLQATKSLLAERKVVTIDGKPAMLGINPITIDIESKWVYFAAMSQGSIFRIQAKYLENFSLKDGDLAKKIENFGYKPNSDGFKIDENDNIYIGDVENLEIGISSNKKYRTYIKSDQLTWVDGLFVANDGFVYATVNQLNRHSNFKADKKDVSVKPYRIIKFKQAD